MENYEMDDAFDDPRETLVHQKPDFSPLLIWIGIILAILVAIFMFIPMKTQVIIQRLRDRKYIRGEKK